MRNFSVQQHGYDGEWGRRLIPAFTAAGLTEVDAGGRILGQHSTDSRTTIVAFVQAGRVHEVQNRMPGLTGGEGIVETQFAGFHPVTVDPPPSRLHRA